MKNSEKIIITMLFDEEIIQCCAESTIKRRLSNLELNRLSLCWPNFDCTGGARNEIMEQFIKEVIDHEDIWADKEYFKLKK
ncbi:MAG TPA: hypothetical protein PK526_03115 [bacterium]|nr:hypothetical protein [bacterium]